MNTLYTIPLLREKWRPSEQRFLAILLRPSPPRSPAHPDPRVLLLKPRCLLSHLSIKTNVLRSFQAFLGRHETFSIPQVIYAGGMPCRRQRPAELLAATLSRGPGTGLSTAWALLGSRLVRLLVYNVFKNGHSVKLTLPFRCIVL